MLSRSEHVICIFMDIRKAFDTVNHSILLEKLSYYSICGNAHEWFTNYFHNGQQFVSVGKQFEKQFVSKSSLRRVSRRVAQGSIVGPLLLILYMNDIVRSSRSTSLVLMLELKTEVLIYVYDSSWF